MVNEKLSLEEQIEESKEDFLKAKKILKEKFQIIYQKVGVPWSASDDRDIDFVIDAIQSRAYFETAAKLTGVGTDKYGNRR